MKNILLPTDFSENAFLAMRYAVRLFRNESCNFYILHTYTSATYQPLMLGASFYSLESQDITQKSAEENVEQLRKKLQKEFKDPKHHFEKMVAFNLLVSELKEIVKQKNIDLVIMGTQGASGAKEIFLGTHTMYTIKKVKCPVIAVPSGYKYSELKEILFVTDFNVSKENPYLELIRNLSNSNRSHVHILNVESSTPLTSVQKENKRYIFSIFPENDVTLHTMKNMDVTEAIDVFSKEHKIDLLVMVHNKHSFFDNILLKPVINDIVYHTNMPFLVIPSVRRLKE